MVPPTRFRTDLEGLRGVAILLVVLFHAGVGGFAGGFIGVDLFFVLSGYFITAGLARELDESGRIDVNEFWGRRMLRLSPPLLVVLFATLSIVMTLYAPIDRAEIAGLSRYVAMYAGNIDLATRARDYFSSTDNPLLHTWSLGVEEQFYILWPLLLLAAATLFSKTRRTLVISIAIAGAASLAANVTLTVNSSPWAFYGVLTRVWEFAVGGLLALWLIPKGEIQRRTSTETMEAVTRRRNILGALAVGFFIVALIRFDEGTPYPGYAALLPVAGVALLVAVGNGGPETYVARALSIQPLRWLGRVSYAWYLWHWPLIGLAEVLQPGIGSFGKVLWSIGALGLAWLTYRYVEGTARDGTLSRIPTDRLALYGVAASFVAVLGATLLMKLAHRQAASGPQRLFAAARQDRFTRSCWANTLDDYKPCFAGDTRASTTVAILGDSHAEHWLGALDRAGKERGWKIDAMVKGGCPVSHAPEMTHPRRVKHYRECARFREAMLQRIIRTRPAVVILSSWDHYIAMDGHPSSWQVTPAQWEAGLRRSYERLTRAGIRTIVMRDVPQTPFDVPQCLSRRAAGLPAAGSCLYDRSRALHPVGVVAQNRAARGLPISFIDMNDVICPTSQCSPVRNGMVIYTDDNHITATFSRSVGDVMGARLTAASRR